ncbi:MAG: chemotaxis protein CheW [Magnetospirillum gryphiswaldense]|uniref:chemotaxis protein CheW n=1 Tax=Magnetospirillum sp. 64-120 TaxID=1895778 RepID=UPI000929E5EA|nr:chemotaxis protein CheW [Magnetospirillum sp. 64-120]MBI2239239.1 chemotaxis protein CheW [Magnetospirillum gryphiswaldense]OJX77456.1 MAG: chemotaxis protein CheW [Magnetospirillum sp. 64-120]
MNQIVPASKRPGTELAAAETQDYVTMFIDGQMFGIAVLTVQDVLGPQKITRIPLAPREVAGSLNLRGRIVTAIDVRLRLGLKRPQDGNKGMSVVVEQSGELYSLMVDQVGEVLSLPVAKFERNPPTLDPMWREFSAGIYRLDDKLLVVLDVAKLLDFKQSE